MDARPSGVFQDRESQPHERGFEVDHEKNLSHHPTLQSSLKRRGESLEIEAAHPQARKCDLFPPPERLLPDCLGEVSRAASEGPSVQLRELSSGAPCRLKRSTRRPSPARRNPLRRRPFSPLPLADALDEVHLHGVLVGDLWSAPLVGPSSGLVRGSDRRSTRQWGGGGVGLQQVDSEAQELTSPDLFDLVWPIF